MLGSGYIDLSRGIAEIKPGRGLSGIGGKPGTISRTVFSVVRINLELGIFYRWKASLPHDEPWVEDCRRNYFEDNRLEPELCKALYYSATQGYMNGALQHKMGVGDAKAAAGSVKALFDSKEWKASFKAATEKVKGCTQAEVKMGKDAGSDLQKGQAVWKKLSSDCRKTLGRYHEWWYRFHPYFNRYAVNHGPNGSWGWKYPKFRKYCRNYRNCRHMLTWQSWYWPKQPTIKPFGKSIRVAKYMYPGPTVDNDRYLRGVFADKPENWLAIKVKMEIESLFFNKRCPAYQLWICWHHVWSKTLFRKVVPTGKCDSADSKWEDKKTSKPVCGYIQPTQSPTLSPTPPTSAPTTKEPTAAPTTPAPSHAPTYSPTVAPTDACLRGDDVDQDDPRPPSDQAEPHHGTEYSIEYDGYKYRALDYSKRTSNSAGCQDKWLDVPKGWSLVPASPRIVKNVIANNYWGTNAIITKEGCAFKTFLCQNTAGCDANLYGAKDKHDLKKQRWLSFRNKRNRLNEAVDSYRAYDCTKRKVRILIRKSTRSQPVVKGNNDGYVYSTLDRHDVHDSEQGYQKQILPIPKGWEMVPFSFDVAKYLVKKYEWGTTFIIFKPDGSTSTSEGHWPVKAWATKLDDRRLDYNQRLEYANACTQGASGERKCFSGYRPVGTSARILLRHKDDGTITTSWISADHNKPTNHKLEGKLLLFGLQNSLCLRKYSSSCCECMVVVISVC